MIQYILELSICKCIHVQILYEVKLQCASTNQRINGGNSHAQFTHHITLHYCFQPLNSIYTTMHQNGTHFSNVPSTPTDHFLTKVVTISCKLKRD
jgi:hypothetical protein